MIYPICAPFASTGNVYFPHLSGNLIFQWLLSQCNDCKMKSEYDGSHCLLTHFLSISETKRVLVKKCINTIIKLKINLESKEEKYAGYVRMSVKNCMDAMTTSPLEGQNTVIKHGRDYVNGNFHLDKSMSKIVRVIVKRLRRRLRGAKKEESETNDVSTAPKKKILFAKSKLL